MDDEEVPEQPYSRGSAYAFLIVGYVASIGIGLFISWYAWDFFNDLAALNSARGAAAESHLLLYSPPTLLVADLILYPPIAVLIVDSMHSLASRID